MLIETNQDYELNHVNYRMNMTLYWEASKAFLQDKILSYITALRKKKVRVYYSRAITMLYRAQIKLSSSPSKQSR